MCFYTSYDWYASVHEEYDDASDRPVVCDECERPIPPGSLIHRIHMEENEFRPDDDEDGEEICGPPAIDEFDPGETFDYARCEDCGKVLKAVEAEERDRGCAARESQPYLGQLREQVGDLPLENRMAYRVRAKEMFPELDNDYLGRILSIYHDEGPAR